MQSLNLAKTNLKTYVLVSGKIIVSMSTKVWMHFTVQLHDLAPFTCTFMAIWLYTMTLNYTLYHVQTNFDSDLLEKV